MQRMLIIVLLGIAVFMGGCSSAQVRKNVNESYNNIQKADAWMRENMW